MTAPPARLSPTAGLRAAASFRDSDAAGYIDRTGLEK